MLFPVLLQTLLVWTQFLLSFGFSDTCEECDSVHYTNSWAVHIEDGDLAVANNIAKRHGFVNKGQIGSLPGYYHFIHKSTSTSRRHRRALDRTELLMSEEKVKWVEQQQVLERDKRAVIPDYVGLSHPSGTVIQDPLFKDQWYLNNIGQSSGPPSLDINILPVWARGITGKNVIVAILDDGLDHTHPDLIKNYPESFLESCAQTSLTKPLENDDPRASYDFNDYDTDPMPRYTDPNNCHGTKCAGEVAAEAGNGICGVGVAFNASIGGIRMLDGNTTDTIEGSALSYHNNYISIYSCAWGPKDDGKRFGRPGTLASKALELGTREGRGGLGSIFVWATGNGGLTDDDCNCDGYTTSIHTVSIGAISDHGLSTYYTESCASTLAVTYSGGSHREKKENKIITTTLKHECTDEFKGTSSAAPLAAGMMALMLEANPKLSWRDVQHIIVETALMTSPLDEGWRRNGAGKWFNQKFGFGRIDASQMVERSLAWDNVPEQRKCWGERSEGPWNIPESGTLLVSSNTTACAETPSEVRSLEHVQLVISLKHRHRGYLSIELISPSGTRSQILKTRRNDRSNKGLKDWVFMSVHFWGEDPRGTWTLAITDNDENTKQHYLLKNKHGDFEDATESLQDEMIGKLSEKADDSGSHHGDTTSAKDSNITPSVPSAESNKDGKGKKAAKKAAKKKQKGGGKATKKKISKKEKHKKEKKSKEKHKVEDTDKESLKMERLPAESDETEDALTSHNFADIPDAPSPYMRERWSHSPYGMSRHYSDDQRMPNDWLGRYNGHFRQKGFSGDDGNQIPPQAFEFKMSQNGSVIPESPGREFSDENVGMMDGPVGPQMVNANNVYRNHRDDRPVQSSEANPNELLSRLKPPTRTPEVLNRAPMEDRKGPSSDGSRIVNVPTTPPPQQVAVSVDAANKSKAPVVKEDQNTTALSSQALIESLVKSVLTEMLTSIRMERNQTLFLDAVGRRLDPSEANQGVAQHDNVTVSLSNALKKGKALEKIDTLLTVLNKSKKVKNDTTNQTKANEVVTDVLKVMHDILGARKTNQQLDVFKKRISKFMEGSSNTTKKLIEKLLKDLEPSEGHDRSTDTITDAISLISAIFGHHKRPRSRLKGALKNGLGNLFGISREWNILLPGPDGSSIVVPYRSPGDLFSGLKSVDAITHPMEKPVANITNNFEPLKEPTSPAVDAQPEQLSKSNVSANETAPSASVGNITQVSVNATPTSTTPSNRNDSITVNQTEVKKAEEKTIEEKSLEEKIAEEKKMVEKIAEERIIAEKIAEEKKAQERKLEERKAQETKALERKVEEERIGDRKSEERKEEEKSEEKVYENRKPDEKGTKEILFSPKQLAVVEGDESNIASWKKETPGDNSENYDEHHPTEEMLAQNVERMGIKGNNDVLRQENLETVHPEESPRIANENSLSLVDNKDSDIDSFTMQSSKLSDSDIDTTVVRSEKLSETPKENDAKDENGLIDVEVVFDPKDHQSKKKAGVSSEHKQKDSLDKEEKRHHGESKDHSRPTEVEDRESVESSKPKTASIPKTFTFNVDDGPVNVPQEISSNIGEEDFGNKENTRGQFFDLTYKDSDPEFKHYIPKSHSTKATMVPGKAHQHLKPEASLQRHSLHGRKRKLRARAHRSHKKEPDSGPMIDFPGQYYKDSMPGLREPSPHENRKSDGEDASNDMLEMAVANSLPFVSVPLPQHDYNLLTSLVSPYSDSFVPEYVSANAIDPESELGDRDDFGSNEEFRQDVRRSYIDYPSSHHYSNEGRYKRDLILPDYTLDRGNSTFFEENINDDVVVPKSDLVETRKYGGLREAPKMPMKRKEKQKRQALGADHNIALSRPDFLASGAVDQGENVEAMFDRNRRSSPAILSSFPPIPYIDSSSKYVNNGELLNQAGFEVGDVLAAQQELTGEHAYGMVDAMSTSFQPASSDSAEIEKPKQRLMRLIDEEYVNREHNPPFVDSQDTSSTRGKVRRRRSLDSDKRASFLVRQKRNSVDVDFDDEDVTENEPHVVKRSAILTELEPSLSKEQEDALRISRRAAESVEEDAWEVPRSYRFNDDELEDEKKMASLNDADDKGIGTIGSLASEVRAGRRSNVRRVASLEGALRRKLLSMRKESGTVLKILQRVHHDISTGNAEDLRDLEIEMAAMEDNDVRRQNLRRPRSDPPKKKRQKSWNFKRKKGKVHKKFYSKSSKTANVRISAQLDNSKQGDGGVRLNPEEYYRYGTGNSGILDQWTLVFYGT